jgi:hypothetical protein
LLCDLLCLLLVCELFNGIQDLKKVCIGLIFVCFDLINSWDWLCWTRDSGILRRYLLGLGIGDLLTLK